MHSQLCLIGSLTLIGGINLQLQHVLSTNQKWGVPPVCEGVPGLGLEARRRRGDSGKAWVPWGMEGQGG